MVAIRGGAGARPIKVSYANLVMQGGGGRSMAQRMNEKDAESERADGREDEKSGKCKCCRAKRRTQYLRNQNAGRLRQMERNVGRIAHHMGRDAGHVTPYQV